MISRAAHTVGLLLFLFFEISCSDEPVSKRGGAIGKNIVNYFDHTESPALTLASSEHPIYTGNPDSICSSDTFYNSEGELSKGRKNCDYSNLTAENIKIGKTVGNVRGTAVIGMFTACSNAGEEPCVVDGTNTVAGTKLNFTAANIKFGTTVGGLSGILIPTPGNCSVDGENSCVVDGITRVAAAKNVTIPGNIKIGTTIAGVAGSASMETHTNCTAANQTGCVTTSTYKSMDLSQAGAGGAAGLTGAGFNAAIAAAGTLEFWDASGARHTAAGDADLTAANIKSGATVFGVAGSATPSPADCAADGAGSCVVDGSSFIAASKAAVTAGNIKAGISLGGVTGGYPSASHPLAADTVATDLTSLGPATAAGSYEFFDSAGTRYTGSIADGGTVTPGTAAQTFSTASTVYRAFTVAGDADLAAANILSGTNIFGIAGSASAESHSACTGNSQTGCVATATWQSADLVNLATGNIKNGVAIAGVTGGYPSASHPLAADTVVTDLTSLGPATATGNYEFFDSTGSRYTGSIADGGTVTPGTAAQSFSTASTVYRAFSVAGDIDLTDGNIKSGTDLFGVLGSSNASPSNCSAGNQTGCIATTTYRTINLSIAGSSTGLTSSNFESSLASSSSFEFWDASGARHTAAGDADLTAANIRSGTTIFGVAGSVAPAPANCAADGADSCVVDGTSYIAASKATVTAGNIKAGVSLGGITGGYPSASHPLAADTVSADLTSLGPATGTGSYEFFDSAGTRYTGSIADGGTITPGTSDQTLSTAATVYRAFTVAGDSDLAAANILSGTNIFGIAGSASAESHSACTGNSQTGCVATATWQSADLANLAAGNVKSGVAIAGVTGDFPSATFPLAGASGTADLDNATFDAKIKAATAFEYWTSDGSRQTGAGDVNIAAANIKSNVVIFGTTGTFNSGGGGTDCTHSDETTCQADAACSWTGSACQVNPWNIRIGTTINGIVGELKTTCRNRMDSSHYNSDTMPPNSAADTSGVTKDWWDTLDDYALGTFPIEMVSGWTTDTDCNSDNWEDITSGTCNATAKDCIVRDKITNLMWTESYPVASAGPASTKLDWSSAIQHCDSLTWGGYSDWRVPTSKETADAAIHGFRDMMLDAVLTGNWIATSLAGNNVKVWTATTASAGNTQAIGWAIARNGGGGYTVKTDTTYHSVICVR